ncbi:MAG: HDOD domain-containing protein [Deltaproteobacteria bacterium]|nr:HDOD domain-containing protein [Deltaproteobacteria bacterium]
MNRALEEMLLPRERGIEGKHTVLFVDDDERVLDGLTRAFFQFRARWKVLRAPGGAAGLEKLSHEPVDVVVSDMRMPVMDGAAFLQQVRERWPSAVRIILSGHADTELTQRALGCAHQWLSKPCDPPALERRLTQILRLRNELVDQKVRGAAGKVVVLPSRIETIQRLQHAVGDEATKVRDLAAIVESDIAVTAKVLQTVNSAFFGLGRRITRADEAIAYLGFAMVRSLVQADLILYGLGAGAEEVERVHRRSTRLARLAFALAPSALASEAFTAALLHDVGSLVLLQDPEGPAATPRFRGLVGAYLLLMWGIPWSIAEAVAVQAVFETNEAPTLALADIVGIARCLLEPPGQGPPLEESRRLQQLGLVAQLPHWRELAANHPQ